MLNRLYIRRVLEISIMASVCLMSSFFNYCLMQIIGAYFLPITIIPLFLALIFEYKVPIILVAVLGLIDDLMLNGPFGLFAFLYSGMAYFVYSKMRHMTNRKSAIALFLSMVLLINICTYLR